MSDPQYWIQRIYNDSRAATEKLFEIRKRLKIFRDNPEVIQKNQNWAFEEFVRCMNETVDFCNEKKQTYVPNGPKSGGDSESQREVKRMQERIQSLENRLADALKDKNQALNRLSDIQCRLLKQGNPEIADLSDDNRPTNLGASFKRVYEDEWTDALTFLTEIRQKRYSDQKAVETLYTLVQKCNCLCGEGSVLQSARVEELVTSPVYLTGSPTSDGQTPSSADQVPTKPPRTALNNPVNAAGSLGNVPVKTGFASSMSAATTKCAPDVTPQNLSKTFVVRRDKPVEQQGQGKALEGPVKEFCKNVAPMVIDQVNIATLIPKINSTREFPADIFDNKDVMKFLSKCVRLCWLMQSQYPPMMLDFSHRPGEPFNTDILTAYSARGPMIAFVVWPPVYLHQGGPLVSKGYAEGKKP